jgi:hypothetical protein
VETQQPITAAYLSYEVDEGDPAQVACYWGEMTFAPHLLRLLAVRRVVASVRFSSGAESFEDRKTAAEVLYRTVLELVVAGRREP